MTAATAFRLGDGEPACCRLVAGRDSSPCGARWGDGREQDVVVHVDVEVGAGFEADRTAIET
jgi:hypothetical protein